MDFESIPSELKAYKSWVCWRYEDVKAEKPTKVPYNPLTAKHAKSNDSNTWCDFESVKSAFLQTGFYNGIGFVLSEADPYALIDLDDTKNDSNLVGFQTKIFNEFDSYAERSPSGNGLHILIKGAIPSGRKRSAVEIYSNLRFMTVTGDVFRKQEIKDYNNLLNSLHKQMEKGSVAKQIFNGDLEEKDTDERIIEIAENAKNGEKFKDLFGGDWEKHYSSQSEADFAIFNILAYYSKNKKQLVRIFQESQLGKRQKAYREDYLKWMLDRVFDRMLPPMDFDALYNKVTEIIEAKQKLPTLSPEVSLNKNLNISLIPPDGLISQLGQFIYAQSARPVPEIALAGALGLFSGIVGRAFNVSNTGLNQYLLLLAPTGTGKESMAKGASHIMSEVVRSLEKASDFLGPGEIASAPALMKYLSRGSVSFVSILGEFGLLMQQMAHFNAPPHLLSLRRFILDLYNKSGKNDVLRPSIYSEKEKNTNAIKSPAVTILGESTPERFYEGLHDGLITEGLLPRFTIIEYKGPRVPLNENHATVKPSTDLILKLKDLCAYSLALNSEHKTVNVLQDYSATQVLIEYEKMTTAKINDIEANEITRNLWTRAHMKALKLAALIAVSQNIYAPIINLEAANWAINIATNDVVNLIAKFNAGEIGSDNSESKQVQKIVDVIKEYYFSSWEDIQKSVGIAHQNLYIAKIVPYSFIHRRLANQMLFKKDKLGSTSAIKRTLQIMVDKGDLALIEKVNLQKEFGIGCVAYGLQNKHLFD